MKKQAFNPFLPQGTYIPDGEPHVFGDRVYLFGSHDKEKGNTYCMLDYEFFSAPVDDLGNWSSNGINYRASQDPLYSEKIPYMFAPDVVRGNDGKFYLYYCMAGVRGQGGYSNPISVAVSDAPDGQYEYLGIVRGKDGKPLMRYVCFDPAVINDNGVIRLYYGCCYSFDEHKNFLTKKLLRKIEAGMFGRDERELKAREDSIMGAITVTLDDDMLSATDEPCRILPTDTRKTDFAGHAFFEGSSIRKIGDLYYFIYSSQNNHELCYATSRYPDRDFTFRGTIISNGDIGLNGRRDRDRLNATGTNHGSIEKIKDHWYVFYHRQTHNSDYSRWACAEGIDISDAGAISQVEMTSCGLNGGALCGKGKYPAYIACNLTNGKMPHINNKRQKVAVPCVSSEDGNCFIQGITKGTQIGYKYFDFCHIRQITVTLRGSAGRMEILDGLDGNILGTVTVEGALEWRRYGGECEIPDGVQAIFFRWRGEGSTDFLEFAFGTENIR